MTQPDDRDLAERVAELERKVARLTDLLIDHSHSAHGGLPYAPPIGPLWKVRNP